MDRQRDTDRDRQTHRQTDRECQGINDMTMVPVRRSMDLSVECKYY